jgi:probable HAF family extracellular repeat protein
MRNYSKNRSSAIRKAVAWALIPLLAACGSGTGSSPDAINTPGSGATLAATTTAVAAVTSASYTVANIGAKFELDSEDHRALNDRGQVVGYIAEGAWTTARACRYEGGTLTDLGTFGEPNNSSTASAINASGLVTGDLHIGNTGNTYRAFRSDGNNMINLGTLGNASINSFSVDISDSGLVAGNLIDGRFSRAFLSDGTTMIDLGALGSEANPSSAVAINASGLIAGESFNGKATHAFLFDGTKMIDLGALRSEENRSRAVAINAGGLVAGNSFNGNATHAFLFDGTKMIDLGALGSEENESNATGINASGLVTGYSQIGNTSHAFLHDGTTMTDLGALGGPSARSEARAINASGQVVGKSQTAENGERAFIKSPGDSQMIDLNSRLINAPGVELFRAVAISDTGYILAEANTGWVLLKPSAPIPAPAAATLGGITANDPVAVGTPVNVSMKFSDINTADTHTAVWTWEGNGNTAGTVTEQNGTVPGTVTGSTTFSAAGLYNVTVSVTDSSGLSSSVGRQVVVYDPSAGFVTGGGWIMSPAGAYKADERMTGRATFGFVSKYLKGASKPTGETEFRFQAGALNFYSNNYDWLVVGGARAQYKGTGTINGRGSYQFMLSAVDGDLIAKGTADRFRIKIWHHDDSTNTDVTDYDNQLDSTVAGSNQEGTILGGGSISVKIR